MKFGCANPQDSKCLFESLDLIGSYSSMDGGKYKFTSEGGRELVRGEERKRKLKNLLIPNSVQNCSNNLASSFTRPLRNKNIKTESITICYTNPLSLR